MGAEEHLAARGEPGDPAALTGRLFRDMTGALELLTVYLGERLGLYRLREGPGNRARRISRPGPPSGLPDCDGPGRTPGPALGGCGPSAARRS